MIYRNRTALMTVLASATLAVSGCATVSHTQAAAVPVAVESIAYEVGPCFGFCPVYNASVTSAGVVSFEGVRHTATLGQPTAPKNVPAYRSFAAALASYRPSTGTTAKTTCETEISDQQHYRIVWTDGDGTKTVLDHDRGCRSARNDALNEVLQNAPEQLGIADWARQVTRPGVGRG